MTASPQRALLRERLAAISATLEAFSTDVRAASYVPGGRDEFLASLVWPVDDAATAQLMADFLLRGAVQSAVNAEIVAR